MEGKLGVVTILVLYFAYNVQATVNCTATGAGKFADPSDTTCKNYTVCVYKRSKYTSTNRVCSGESLFNPSTSKCTTNYTCNATSADSSNSTNSTSCTAEGFFSDPNSSNCSGYIQCVSVNGSYVETNYTCPNTYFNPDTTLCVSHYNCTSSTPFQCSSAGRFDNTSDTTCKTYYFCVHLSDGTYVKNEYTCPSTSIFNPTSKMCTTSHTCSS